MASNKTNWCYQLNGTLVYAYGSTAKQAAMALHNKYKVYVDERFVYPVAEPRKEVKKPMYVYTFAYKNTELAMTNYVECLAKSEKQAWFYFSRILGRPWFAEINEVHLASEEDIERLKEGELFTIFF